MAKGFKVKAAKPAVAPKDDFDIEKVKQHLQGKKIVFIIFFLVVTPTGIIMKLLGKDLIKLKKNNEKSYWIEKKNIKSRMKNLF